jgi:uncharacterized protein YkwD
MQRFLFVVTVVLVAMFALTLLLTGCQSGPAPTPTETAAPQPTSAPTFTRTPPPTWTPTAEPSPTLVDTPTPAATPTPVPEDVWVDSASGLNLRAEASTTAKLVASLKPRQHLVIIGPATGPDANGITWQNVRTDDGLTGWASAQFLTKTNPAGSTPAPTAAAAATTPPPAPTQAPATAAPPAAASGEAWVNSTNGLNLRSQAVATSTVIAVLPFGAHVALTGAPQGPDAGGITWQNVRADDGKAGFVAAQFLSATKPVTTTAATPVTTAPVTSTTPATATPVPATTGATGNVYVIATNGLNLRSQPNTTAGVVATLTYGQRLTALAPKSAPDASGVAWQNVRTDANQTGWASADYLSATPPITTTTAPTGTTVVNVASDLWQRINDLRSQNNVGGVKLNGQLTAAAQVHSQDMAKTGNISHLGSDGSLAPQRIGAAGYGGQQRDEIIYGGQASVNDAWFYWTNDRLHANVILNPIYTDVGIAAVTAGNQTYYTITFGGP